MGQRIVEDGDSPVRQRPNWDSDGSEHLWQRRVDGYLISRQELRNIESRRDVVSRRRGVRVMFFGLKCGKCCTELCKSDSIYFPCPITLVHIDENRCEDDVFNIYIENPTTKARRFISELDLKSTPPGCCNSTCPQTRIDITASVYREDLDSQCRFTIVAVFVRPNCCLTLTRLRIIGPDGQELIGSYFGQGGYSQTFQATSVCDTAPAP